MFVTESGEWRLGGLDLLSSTRPTELETGVLWFMGGLVAGKEGVSPEVHKEGWNALKTSVRLCPTPPSGQTACAFDELT